MADEPIEPLDAGDDDDAHAPADLVELHEILAYQKALEEQERGGG